MLRVKIDCTQDGDTSQVIATFDLHMAASILAAAEVIMEAELEYKWFDNESDREHFMALATAIKAHFDVLEVLG